MARPANSGTPSKGPVRLAAENSAVFLPEDLALRRRVRAPWRKRPQDFLDAYETRGLYYDCFWHADGKRILLVGPPPLNLRYEIERAQFRTQPLDTWSAVRHHTTLSVTVTELIDVPPQTVELTIELAGRRLVVPVRPNASARLAGRRILFSMNRDNDLGWIKEWATWHARRHGTDAVILFDNGSTRYGPDDVAETLAGVDGLADYAVPSWPYRFGRADRAVLVNPYWAHFLQNASMSVVLRRFGAAAEGILNCDIDELTHTGSGRSIYDHAAAAAHGLVTFRGTWIESVPAPDAPKSGRTHRHYHLRLKDPKAARCASAKWALDPRRPWVESLSVHPYWHWIANRPLFGKTQPADAGYWHFKAINTNWKEGRTEPPAAGDLEPDPELVAAFAREPAA